MGEVLVERVVAGDTNLIRNANPHERRAVVARFLNAGIALSRLEIAGLRPQRYLPTPAPETSEESAA